jgi:hypothetical protein
LGVYEGRKFLEVRSIGKFMRLGGSENFVMILMSGGLVGLGGRKVRQDVLAGNKYIFVTLFRFCMLYFR